MASEGKRFDYPKIILLLYMSKFLSSTIFVVEIDGFPRHDVLSNRTDCFKILLSVRRKSDLSCFFLSFFLACSQAHALEFIDEFEDGFDTQIGERGIRVSGGQRQRLAIASIAIFFSQFFFIVLGQTVRINCLFSKMTNFSKKAKK